MRRDERWRTLRLGLRRALLLVALTAPAVAAAQDAAPPKKPATCPPRNYRWLEDCRNLADLELHGLPRLRYLPLAGDGGAWLTLAGEARARLDALHDIDFGINGAPGYDEVSGRLLLSADLRTAAGPRAFAQLGVVQETGRKPGPRAQDHSQLDVTQAFLDLPLDLSVAKVALRLGRQEMDVSGNRLINTRDGSTLRRSFEGVKADVFVDGARISLIRVRPMELQYPAFADRADPTERFNALSVDLPHKLTGPGLVNLFLLDRKRQDARYLRAQGDDRRYSMGARYAGPLKGWIVDAQATWQTGKTEGLPVQAYALALSADHELEGPWSVGLDAAAVSGDKGDTRTIETFDPTYPNNGGLSDAPLFYQTNFVFAGGGLSVNWKRAIWTVQSNLLLRQSTTDAVYSAGRPINADFGDGRMTSLLSQVSVRKQVGPNYELYASLVKADALTSIRHAGGEDAFYSRIQLTARF